MERYKSDNEIKSSRVSKNNNLYESIKTSDLSRVRNNDNMRVIESNGKTIDIAKIKKYLEENNKNLECRKRPVIVENIEIENEEITNDKDYDINSVLENAKRSREIDYDRERYKKLKREEYDILSKLKAYDNEEVPLEKEDFNTEEKTLIDLINTVTLHKGNINLLEELIGGEGEETTLPIKEEIQKEKLNNTSEKVGLTEEIPVIENINTTEKVIKEEPKELNKTKELVDLKEKTMELDNSFYTSSMKFSKEDFEGFDELEKNVKKNSAITIFLLILLIIFIIATLVVIANYIFNLGLF